VHYDFINFELDSLLIFSIGMNNFKANLLCFEFIVAVYIIVKFRLSINLLSKFIGFEHNVFCVFGIQWN